MNRRKTSRTKPMTRRQLADVLRQQIVAGVYRPGEELPSRNLLCTQLNSSYMTVQAAVKELESEEFVHSQHGKATYVAEHPPHLCHYGLLLPVQSEMDLRSWTNRFLHVFLDEAERFNAVSSERQIYTWQDSPEDIHHRGYEELLSMVRSRRLAGVVYPHPPGFLQHTELFETPGVIHVTAALPRFPQSSLTHVAFRRESFYRRAIERISNDGRKRMAVLTTRTNMDLESGHLVDLVTSWGAAYGLTTRPFWVIPLDATLAAGIRATTRLLFNAPAEERPDALIIDDDHMVEAASLALATAGLDTETDITVVSHANFPDRPPAAVPTVYLGLDCRELLKEMLDVIDKRTKGEYVASVNWVEPVFEEEYEQRYQE